MTAGSTPDPDTELAAAKNALAKLELELGDDSDVSFIDVAYEREPGSSRGSHVLRVHMRDRWFAAKPNARVAVPSEVDSFPVVVTRGEYELE